MDTSGSKHTGLSSVSASGLEFPTTPHIPGGGTQGLLRHPRYKTQKRQGNAENTGLTLSQEWEGAGWTQREAWNLPSLQAKTPPRGFLKRCSVYLEGWPRRC